MAYMGTSYGYSEEESSYGCTTEDESKVKLFFGRNSKMGRYEGSMNRFQAYEESEQESSSSSSEEHVRKNSA